MSDIVIGSRVTDLTESELGDGEVVNIYTNYNDNPRGVIVYTVDFLLEGDVDEDEDLIFDRLQGEIELIKLKMFKVERSYTLRMYQSDYYEIEAKDKEEAQGIVEEDPSEPYKTKSWDCDEDFDTMDWEISEI